MHSIFPIVVLIFFPNEFLIFCLSFWLLLCKKRGYLIFHWYSEFQKCCLLIFFARIAVFCFFLQMQAIFHFICVHAHIYIHASLLSTFYIVFSFCLFDDNEKHFFWQSEHQENKTKWLLSVWVECHCMHSLKESCWLFYLLYLQSGHLKYFIYEEWRENIQNFKYRIYGLLVPLVNVRSPQCTEVAVSGFVFSPWCFGQYTDSRKINYSSLYGISGLPGLNHTWFLLIMKLLLIFFFL